jgi:hypothetical protein
VSFSASRQEWDWHARKDLNLVMDTFALKRFDKPQQGDSWQFEVDGGAARLVGPDGQGAATFTPDEAYQDVELVHFAKSGHNIAIAVAGEELHFTAWPKAFKGIKAFTELSSHAASEPELQRLRRSGLVRLILGGVLFAGGSILSLDGLLKLGGFGGGGEHYIFYGAIVFGAVFLWQSYYYYAEARRRRKLHT